MGGEEPGGSGSVVDPPLLPVVGLSVHHTYHLQQLHRSFIESLSLAVEPSAILPLFPHTQSLPPPSHSPLMRLFATSDQWPFRGNSSLICTKIASKHSTSVKPNEQSLILL